MSDLTSTSLLGLPRIYLRPCLLLLLGEGSSHGYDLLEQIHTLGLTGVDAGGLYRTLRGLDRDELLTSWWEPSQNGPARRTYELTEYGREELFTNMEATKATHQLLGELLERYETSGVRR